MYGQGRRQTCRKALNKKDDVIGLLKKPKLDNARKLKDIYYIDPDDVEFKDTMRKMGHQSKQLQPLLSLYLQDTVQRKGIARQRQTQTKE